MKSVLLTLATLVSISAFANDPNLSKSQGASTCTDCESSANKFKAIDDFQAVIKKGLTCDMNAMKAGSVADSQTCTMLSWAEDTFEEYPHCRKFFVDEKGQVGELATYIASLIADDIKKERDGSVFMKSNPDFDNMCPGFNKMTPEMRVAFYTWLFEITAFMETTCDPTKVNSDADVPNGPAVGLYQLEERVSLREWRGPLCKVSVKEIRTAKGNTGCAFEIMKSHLRRNERPLGVLNADRTKRIKGSYWHSHNPLTKLQREKLEASQKKAIANKQKPTDHPYDKFARYLPRFPLCGKN